MRRLSAILLVLLLLIGLALLAHAQESQETPLIPPDQAILSDMYARINALRERRGLPPYRLNDMLNRAAQDQAEYLVRTGRRGHFRPDGSRPSTRAAAYGFVSSHWCCGENYYMSIDATPDMVYDFWRWSPSHLINMIHRDFTDIGLGMSSDGYRISYVTVFGEADDLHPPEPSTAQAQPVSDQQPAAQTGNFTAPVPSGEYIVLPGDTLGRIASRYNTTVRTLMTLNRITNPEIIYPGQHIALPGTSVPTEGEAQPTPAPPQENETASQSAQTHRVVVGETLARIAARYGTTVQALVAANNIANPSLIYAGQVLTIPSDAPN
ncbi:MAG TPA: LysM peptidoglycan-binding domain-containing protein [Oceanobacillus sp.]|nr:LysM peptidoglycan-binding domain-containing protein [Oceanobacillus sp.]